MPVVLRRRRHARKALKLARILAALDPTANAVRPVQRRTSRVSLRRAV